MISGKVELIPFSMEDVVSAMSDYNTTLLVTLASVLLTLYYWPIWNRRKYPPGPMPLPFLGNIFWTAKFDFLRRLAAERHRYGEVVTLYLSNSPIVILNSSEAVYEGFVKNADYISQRPPVVQEPTLLLTQGRGMINELDGRWQQLRRFLLSVFKDHGVGKAGMEVRTMDELSYFVAALKLTNGKPIDIQPQLTQSISNIATSIVFGTRFDYSEEQLENLQFTEFVAKSRILILLPMLKYLPFDLIGYQEAKRKATAGINFAKQQIETHKKELHEENARDVIDSFLIEMKKDNGNPPVFTDDNLQALVMQLYIAGTDTTSTSLYWVYLYLVVYPEIQQRIYLEVKETIGERKVQYSDRSSLHFTMSFLTEVMRRGVALGTIPHYTTKAITVRGKTIPAGTTVRANIYAACHDERIFNDPEAFKPDRFLDEEGKFMKPDVKTFIPFGIGRRICPGAPLAKMEMFLFLVTTIQNFRVELGQSKTPSTEGYSKFLWQPRTYYVRFISRNE